MTPPAPTQLLYVISRSQRSATPVIDDLTLKMTAAFQAATPGLWSYGLGSLPKGFLKGASFRGVHECGCGAQSTACDYLLTGGHYITNALCIHYLAWHRDEVSPEDLEIVAGLPEGTLQPTAEQLQ